MSAGPWIVCLSSMGWNGPWTRKQRFMLLLAERGHRVLYVEPPSPPFVRSGGREHLRPALRPEPRRLRPDLDLYLLPSVLALPFGARHPLPFAVNRVLAQQAVRRAMRRLGARDALVWTYLPWEPALLPRRWLVYDCVDQHAAYPGVNGPMLARSEERLLRRVDLLLVSAEGLLREKAPLARRSLYVPNGVDSRLFARGLERPLPLLDAVPRPRVGFVGSLYGWIDVSLLEGLARLRPQWSLVLVGPTNQDLSRLLALPNVHYFGPRPRDEVPAWVARFDAAVNPFRAGELARHVNPLKVWEYLAAGVPVVSTDMPEVRRLGDLVYLAEGPDGFVACLERALAEGRLPERVAARREAARRHDWAVLFERALAAVREATGAAL